MSTTLAKAWALLSGVKNPLPAVLDRLGLRHQPYVLELHDGMVVELRPRAGDLWGFFEIMLRRDYFAAGQQLRRGAIVIDIGANIGCFTVLAASMVGPAGRVFAVEPEESTYQQLLRNIQLNELTNVTPLKLAVGPREGTIALHVDKNFLFSSLYSLVNGRAIQSVSMTTLDALMCMHNITRCDYLKLDCEGAEHEIIQSMSQDTAERITQITMEVHKIPGFDPQAMWDRLEALGYQRKGVSTLPYYERSSAT